MAVCPARGVKRGGCRSGVALLALALLVAPLLAVARPGQQEGRRQQQSSPGSREMIYDAIICRPLGIVGTVVGSALFVVTLPFSISGGNVEDAAEKLVYEPARFTFTRPLGSAECIDPQ